MTPFVSVIIPCRNEVRFIAGCLESVLSNDYAGDRFEVLVVDGMSDDGTREILSRFCAHDPRVRMLDNPDRITPSGLNRGIHAAQGEIIARVDAHARIARDYLSLCVKHLEESRADNVGGVMRTLAQGPGPFSEPILLVLSHPFGVGNSHFRVGSDAPRWVDTVFGGCWRRDLFARIGGFNVKLRRSQDMEFSRRLAAAGGRTLLAPDVRSEYFARTRFIKFLRHNFVNGQWAILPFLHCQHIPVSWRHLIPLAFVLTLMSAAMAFRAIAWPMAVVAGVYLLVNLGVSAQLAVKKSQPFLFFPLAITFFGLHFSYGAGSLCGLVQTAGILSLRLTRRFFVKPTESKDSTTARSTF